jgi:hypothetical protein
VSSPLFVQHKTTVANNTLASEVDEPRSRRSGRDSEDLADRMCRLGLMSGGLGDRDVDFVRRSTRPRRGEDFVRSSTRREGPRRNRGYVSTGESTSLTPASTTATLVALATAPTSRVVRDASVAAWRWCLASGEDALDAVRW